MGKIGFIELFGAADCAVRKGKKVQDLLSFLQSRSEQMQALLKVLVEQESPSHHKAANDALALILAEQFEVLTGGKAQIIPNAQGGDQVRGEWGKASQGAPQILLLGHFDTVWPLGTLHKMPFRLEGDKAFGPGIFDMKAGLVQGFFALAALRALNRQVGANVVFLMTADEEIGSHTSRALIETEAARSQCVLVLEPAASGALKTARKGTGHFQLTVTGRSAHAGLEPENGRSAIEELARQIVYLHGLSDLGSGTTLNVGRIEGGTASNVVAARALAELDVRVPTQSAADKILGQIQGLKPFMEGTQLNVTGGFNRPPMERTAGTAALFEIAQHIARQEMNLELQEVAVGGASDGNFTSHLAPTLDGLGAVGEGAHAAHEQIVWPEMPHRSALLARLIEEISNHPISHYENANPEMEGR